MGCNCKKKANDKYADGDTMMRRNKILTILMNILLYSIVFIIMVVCLPVLFIVLFVSIIIKKPVDITFLTKHTKKAKHGSDNI